MSPMPSAAAPSPQEIHRKLSVHSVSRTKISPTAYSVESDSDSANASEMPPTHVHSTFLPGTSSSQPPLSSIAERRSASGDDSEDEEDVAEGGWKTASDSRKPSNSVDESVIKSGYLWKKGERRKTWKKRWFVLRPAHLAYYKNSAEYQLLRLLELSDVHSCIQVTLKRRENTFSLISPVRTFYLQANSSNDVQQWLAAIEDARQALMATSTQNSAPIAIPGSRSAQYASVLASSSPTFVTPAAIGTSSDSEDASGCVQRGYSAPTPSHMTFSVSPPRTHAPPKDSVKPILSGYLMKCGSKRRTWRKRWFVLTSEKLVYSGSHMDTRPHRQFLFSEILDALEYDLRTVRHGGALVPPITTPPIGAFSSETEEGDDTHTFKIVTTQRTLLVCAPGEEDEIRWLGAIRALIARRNGSGLVPGCALKSALSAPGLEHHGGLGGSRGRVQEGAGAVAIVDG